MRIPEPSPLMEDLDKCKIYNDSLSRYDVLKEYVKLYQRIVGVDKGTIIDLGSGSCNFVIALAEKYSNLNFVCYEPSLTMINLARENIKNKKLSHRITLVQDQLENAVGKYDVVLANRVLHHIDDTKMFWKKINNLSDKLLVVDIDHPPTDIIDSVTDEDLHNSMKAAYSFEEVYQQVKQYKYTVARDKDYKLYVYHTR